MNNNTVKLALLAVITFLPLTLSGCLLLAGAGAGAGAVYVAKDDRPVNKIIDDASITGTIKTKYIEDKDIKAFDINVDTRRGVVTLYGSVPYASTESKAVRIAESVEGVKQVISKLTIVPPKE